MPAQLSLFELGAYVSGTIEETTKWDASPLTTHTPQKVHLRAH